MDKIVFPILLSLLCGTVLSASLSDTNLNKEYEERLDQAKDRALKLITELIADDTAQDQYTGEEGANVVEVNIPMLESLLANADDDGDDEVIDAEDAAQLILNALSSNERSSEGKRAGGFECLEESCGEIERRRKPNRNAHYRTLPFGKKGTKAGAVNSQKYEEVSNEKQKQGESTPSSSSLRKMNNRLG